MSRPVAATFVDSFFTRTLFQQDDALAESVLAADLAPDATISVSLISSPFSLPDTLHASVY